MNCNDPEFQDDPLLDDYNVDDIVARAVAAVNLQEKDYVGDTYWTLGFDFNYEYAEEWFTVSSREVPAQHTSVGNCL